LFYIRQVDLSITWQHAVGSMCAKRRKGNFPILIKRIGSSIQSRSTFTLKTHTHNFARHCSHTLVWNVPVLLDSVSTLGMPYDQSYYRTVTNNKYIEEVQ